MVPPPPSAVSDLSAPSRTSALAGEAGAASARSLEGGGWRPLGNRNVGVLCADPQRPEALLLQRVLSELGARTALVCPNLDGHAPTSIDHTARVLGLLYDAVLCVDLPAAAVGRLRECAGIPVLADLELAGVVGSGQSAKDVWELGRQILDRLAAAPA